MALRCKLSGKAAAANGSADPDAPRAELAEAAAALAQVMPVPEAASEGLAALQAARDNRVFSALQTALDPAATQKVRAAWRRAHACTPAPACVSHVSLRPCCCAEGYANKQSLLLPLHLQAFAKARADALARVGSRSPAADLISTLLLWARSGSWLPVPLLTELLQLAVGDPTGQQGRLVVGAYELLQALAKVCLHSGCCACARLLVAVPAGRAAACHAAAQH